METAFIPTESEIKAWVKEAVSEFFEQAKSEPGLVKQQDENFSTRKEIAALLGVSLVTLTDWVKCGLPCHKQRGRVYFLRSEVVKYIKQNQICQFPFSSRYIDLENK